MNTGEGQTMKFVFFGAPGAGKGTMASKASAAFGLPHISTGEIFRSAMRDGTPLGLTVKSIIDAGGLVSDELSVDLVRERLGLPDAQAGWLLDGFPRTIGQAEALDSFCPEDFVIDLAVGDEKVIERLSGRRMCKKCSRIYHTKFMPTKKPDVCDACEGDLYIRDDDREESVRVRLEHYRRQTAPLEAYYEKRGTLVKIDGEGDAESVWNVVHGVMKGLVEGRRA
jgi:adenylate kinase